MSVELIVAEVEAITDPLERARAAAEALERCRAAVGQLAGLRRTALREFLGAGPRGARAIAARELGVSPGRITRMLDQPEQEVAPQ